MVYAAQTKNKQLGFVTKLKAKIGKIIAKDFPLNRIRILGLKLCGFDIGNQVYIGEDLIIASIISERSCFLKIGDRAAIGPRVTLLLSSDANWSTLMDKIEHIKGKIVIEEDCWIGAGVIIMPNITIGKCAIIGAGAVVTKDVKPYSTVVGNPAKDLKN